MFFTVLLHVVLRAGYRAPPQGDAENPRRALANVHVVLPAGPVVDTFLANDSAPGGERDPEDRQRLYLGKRIESYFNN